MKSHRFFFPSEHPKHSLYGGKCIYDRFSNFPRDCDFDGTRINTQKAFWTLETTSFYVGHYQNIRNGNYHNG
jgi:hypothetical protein